MNMVAQIILSSVHHSSSLWSHTFLNSAMMDSGFRQVNFFQYNKI